MYLRYGTAQHRPLNFFRFQYVNEEPIKSPLAEKGRRGFPGRLRLRLYVLCRFVDAVQRWYASCKNEAWHVENWKELQNGFHHGRSLNPPRQSRLSLFSVCSTRAYGNGDDSQLKKITCRPIIDNVLCRVSWRSVPRYILPEFSIPKFVV